MYFDHSTEPTGSWVKLTKKHKILIVYILFWYFKKQIEYKSHFKNAHCFESDSIDVVWLDLSTVRSDRKLWRNLVTVKKLLAALITLVWSVFKFLSET